MKTVDKVVNGIRDLVEIKNEMLKCINEYIE